MEIASTSMDTGYPTVNANIKRLMATLDTDGEVKKLIYPAGFMSRLKGDVRVCSGASPRR
jgi:hypothetical protein